MTLKEIILKQADIQLNLLSLGAILHQVWVKDKAGKAINVLVGFKKPEDYLHNPYSMGATIGRYAGRISGSFCINDKKYSLFNENGVHLHGGKTGFAQKIWQVEAISENAVTFVYLSPDGEENYPGNLNARTTYRLLENGYEIMYEAETDCPTYVNLTNHAYYNLSGKGSVTNHLLKLNCDRYLETDTRQIPTGKILCVDETPFDFKEEKILTAHPQFKGIDDCFLLNDNTLPAATLFSPETGLRMRVFTDQPAVVIFTPHDFGSVHHHFKDRYSAYSSICFETQKPPDAPNHPQFPTALLHPGERYVNKTQFLFENL